MRHEEREEEGGNDSERAELATRERQDVEILQDLNPLNGQRVGGREEYLAHHLWVLLSLRELQQLGVLSAHFYVTLSVLLEAKQFE